MDKLRTVSKAIAGGVVGLATYVIGVGFNYTDPLWYAGAIVFLGAGYGIVWAAPTNRPAT